MEYEQRSIQIHGAHEVTVPLISVIDDNERVRSSIAALVRSLGFRVGTYASAINFLNSEARQKSQCIITDIHMPGMTGIALKRALDEEGCRTPVIMITARQEESLHDEALASGALCLLKKPFTPDCLVFWIEKALAF